LLCFEWLFMQMRQFLFSFFFFDVMWNNNYIHARAESKLLVKRNGDGSCTTPTVRARVCVLRERVKQDKQ
jgi:hypothetical protein